MEGPNVVPFKKPPAIRWNKVDGRWINQSNEVEAIAVVKIRTRHSLFNCDGVLFTLIAGEILQGVSPDRVMLCPVRTPVFHFF